MRKILMNILALLACAALAGCSGAPVPTEAPTPAPTAVVMPADTAPATAGPAATDREPEEEYEAERPLTTPWPEPDKVEYGGRYLDVAADREPSRYPKLALSDTFTETTWGALRLPEGWSVADADGFEPAILDGKGRQVGMIFQLQSYPGEPWFSLKNESHIPISWETPDYLMDARVLTVESDSPSAGDRSQITIIRQVAVITDGPKSEGDDTYFAAACLMFDKAYVDGDKVEYVLSNQVIDEIARSFVEWWMEN